MHNEYNYTFVQCHFDRATIEARRNSSLLKMEISRRSPDSYRDFFVEMTRKENLFFIIENKFLSCTK
jgi:hypothetical protein